MHYYCETISRTRSFDEQEQEEPAPPPVSCIEIDKDWDDCRNWSPLSYHSSVPQEIILRKKQGEDGGSWRRHFSWRRIIFKSKRRRRRHCEF
jgi:hypothetical protein